MTKHGFAVVAAALVFWAAQAYAQPRDVYHWRSFTEVASVWYSEEDGAYNISLEKYGSLAGDWPTTAFVSFHFYALGVHGECYLPADAVTFDRLTGTVELTADVSATECYALEGFTSLRIEATWRPTGTYHSTGHTNARVDYAGPRSSEQVYSDYWNAAVEGRLTLDGGPTEVPIPQALNAWTQRYWGAGVALW